MRPLSEELKSMGVLRPEEKAAALLGFMELVLARNEVVNLTNITARDEFVEKHLLDSLCCFGWPELESAHRIIDVGTGAGFPGIPLAILYPYKEFLLMDTLGKRVDFLNEAAKALGLNQVKVLHSRAEDAGRLPDYRERFDLCVSRAVAPLSTLMEYCLPFVKTGGWFYAYKTNKAVAEIESSEAARDLLGGASQVEVRAVNPRRGEGGRREDSVRETTGFGGAATDEAAARFGGAMTDEATAGFGGAATDEAAAGFGGTMTDAVAGTPYGHNIMVIEKLRATPQTYPRKAGTPKRVPL